MTRSLRHDVCSLCSLQLKATTEALFCSELVTFYYQQAGWMSKEQLPCRFVPNDLTDSTSANVSRFLKPGISLGPMILVEEDMMSC